MQTKTVYDGLLDDKQAKLIDDLVQQKQEYDAKCNMYAQESHDKVGVFSNKYVISIICVTFIKYRDNMVQQSLMLLYGMKCCSLYRLWEGIGDVGSVRYKPVLLPPCLTIGFLSYRLIQIIKCVLKFKTIMMTSLKV